MVTVKAHPTTNALITPSANNPEFGTMRVDSVSKVFNNGFFNESKRTAFIRGKIADLTGLGWTANKQVQGQIIKRESFSPFYDGQTPKINPTTGEVVLKDGKESFLEHVYVTDMSLTDTWVGESTAVLSAEAQSALASQEV